MNAPTTAACPQCKAPVSIGPRNDHADCARCGTRAFVMRDRSASPPLGSPVIYLGPASTSGAPLVPLLAGLALALVGAGAFFALSAGKRVSQSLPISVPGLPVTLPGANAASFQFADRPLLVDVDGDGVQDV